MISSQLHLMTGTNLAKRIRVNRIVVTKFAATTAVAAIAENVQPMKDAIMEYACVYPTAQPIRVETTDVVVYVGGPSTRVVCVTGTVLVAPTAQEFPMGPLWSIHVGFVEAQASQMVHATALEMFWTVPAIAAEVRWLMLAGCAMGLEFQQDSVIALEMVLIAPTFVVAEPLLMTVACAMVAMSRKIAQGLATEMQF